MQTNQNAQIRDHVFPLILGSKVDEGIAFKKMIGTGFLIGKSGFALTCGHVMSQLLENRGFDDLMLGLFVTENNEWCALTIENYEIHPTEDVAVLKLKDCSRHSILRLSDRSRYSGHDYHCWGYPYEIGEELLPLDEGALIRPDLLFTKGYVRRRISRELYPTSLYKGENFYELSEQAGPGNSGGPLVSQNSINPAFMEVFGIYMGERDTRTISYGVRADAFAHWSPVILGRTILTESQDSGS